jgi:hypothetical protein
MAASVQIQSDDSRAFREASAGRDAEKGDVNHLFDPEH